MTKYIYIITFLFIFSVNAVASEEYADAEFNSKVDFFVQLRKGAKRSYSAIRKSPSFSGEIAYRLRAGDILKMSYTRDEYRNRMRRDFSGKGKWTPLNDPNHFVYDNWESFVTIGPEYYPLPLKLNIPPKNKLVTVYRDPGHVSYKACIKQPDQCVAWLNEDSKIALLDTSVETVVFSKKRIQSVLFYKIKYAYYAKDYGPREGEGWLPAGYFERPFDLPAEKGVQRGLAGVSANDQMYLSRREINKLFIGKGGSYSSSMVAESENSISSHHGFRRWPKPKFNRFPASEGSSMWTFLDTKISWLTRVDYQNLEISNQHFLGNDVSQGNAQVGLGWVAPIFYELEAMGHLKVSFPVTKENSSADAVGYVSVDGDYMYSTPIKFQKSPLKLTVGGDFSYFNNLTLLGINGIAGLKGGVLLETPYYSSHLRIGPIMSGEGPRMGNFDINLDLGWRIQPKKGFNSWVLKADFRKMEFYTRVSRSRTHLSSFLVGLEKNL